ncbi:MAG: hypothetical protein IT250_15370 [Chitinophagaceae bacterium]|nr:hypothetical protein [Chitinophagaceae bacterium]
MAIPINLVYEDDLSEYVLAKLLSCFGDKYHTGHSYNGRGFGYIKSNINGFNNACKSIPFLVLTDLDNCPCPPQLITTWFQHSMHANMIFRIAVREVESWLLADIEGLSDFLGISPANFPVEPEKETDPKKTLIRLVKRSRKGKIKRDIIPINDNATIGPNYNGRLMQFVFENWDIERAMNRSISLRKAYNKLKAFK